MWGEYIDGSALLNTAWPRAAAVRISPGGFGQLWQPRTQPVANRHLLLCEKWCTFGHSVHGRSLF